MYIVHVFAHTKPDQIEAFKSATLENARNSLQETGVARFDVIQQADERSRFLLVEIYRSVEATAAHKETAHYHAWLAKVDDMFAEPRTRALYTNAYPTDQAW